MWDVFWLVGWIRVLVFLRFSRFCKTLSKYENIGTRGFTTFGKTFFGSDSF